MSDAKQQWAGWPDDSPEERLAFILSEIMDDSAPIGWEKYRGAACCLLHNKEAREIILAEGHGDE